jgi:hypothetical protein
MKVIKGFMLQAFLAGLTILSIIALGELSIRFLQYVRDGRPLLALPCRGNVLQESPLMGCDSTLGWKTPANQRQNFGSKDFAGVKHAVHYSTGPYGFRLYGDAKSSSTKMMIVGDSFTHAVDVSDDQTYYAKLKRDLSDRIPVEIFAYGTNGYGTLQEVMLVERHIKEIMPDILILQVCQNDFINNSLELESKSYFNNNNLRRPYLASDGTITMQIAQPPFGRAVLWAASYSRFVLWVSARFNNWIAVNKRVQTVEDDIRDQPAHPGFMRAVALTDRLLERLRSAVPAATKIYAFQVDHVQPFSREFEKLFARHGIISIEGVPEALTDASRKGEVVYQADAAHWTSTGHAIAAEILANRLRFD